MKSVLAEVFVGLRFSILPRVSEALREGLKESLELLEKKALSTENPYDDMFVLLLKGVLGYGS